MAIETTPLGFQKPDGTDPVKNGDNVIAANAQKSQDLLSDARARLANVENAAGFTGDPLELNDTAVAQAVAAGAGTTAALDTAVTSRVNNQVPGLLSAQVPPLVQAQVPPLVASAIASDPTVASSAATMAQSTAGLVPVWKASTAYVAGQKVIAPNGDVVAAKINFTSGATYSATNWNASTQDGRISYAEAKVTTGDKALIIYGNGYVPAPHPAPDADTLGLWSMDQTLADSSGKGRTLTQYSTLQGVYSATRRFGYRALGGGIYENVGADLALSSTGADGGTLLNGTVECWILTAPPGTNPKVAVSHINWYWLGIDQYGKAAARYGTGPTNNEKVLTGTTALHGADLASASWHHLALVFTNGAGSLYVDGVLEGSNAATGTTGAEAGGVTVGGLRTTRAYDFWVTPGIVDEVRISSVPRYKPTSSYPPRPAGLAAGKAMFVGPMIPPERQPYDQWMKTSA